MRSPFAAFRKHQRMLMVVTIGLSLFAFVICAGVPDPSNMPQPLLAIAIICMCGGIAWIAGVRSKKSSETSLLGLIIGAALAFLLIYGSGPPVAVQAETGNITRDDLQDLRNQRQIANSFVAQAISRTHLNEIGEVDVNQVRMLIPQYQFGLGLDRSVNSDRDVVTSELLRREADKLGLFVPEGAIYDYINEITDKGMTPDIFKDVRQNLRIGETELFEILTDELQGRMAAEFLYDYDYDQLSRLSPTLPPEQYWQFYRQMWLQQSAEVAVIPVDDFVNDSMDPPVDALLAMFEQYRGNYPNYTSTFQLEEGRFGFMQPRKFEVASLEVVFDDVRDTVDEVTAEEVDEYYQEYYVQPAEDLAAAEAAARILDDDGPLFENPQSDQSESPDQDSPDSTTPDAEPTENDSSETSAAPAENPTDNTPNPDDEPGDNPAPDSTPDEDSEEPETTNEPPDTGSARIPGPALDDTQFVAFQQVPPQDPDTGEEPARDDQPEPSASTEDPATTESDDDAADSTTTESDPESTESETDSDPDSPDTAEASDPSPPESAVPPLTEALREQIRIEVTRERTVERMQDIASDAVQAFSDLGFRMSLPENNPEYLTAEQISQEIARYAEEHGLYYSVTPRLSYNDLLESEEHPVGGALVADRGTVAEVFSNSNPDDLYRADIAEGLDTDSRFVFWKVVDHESDQPDSIDDEGVREQVEEAWRIDQARTSARNRAEELLLLIDAADGDMQAALGEQTITGDLDDDALVVVPTGDFRWLSDPDAPRPNPFSFYPPRIRDPNGVTDVGPEFMETVFNQLDPDEVGIAANGDKSEFYLVKIVERSPSNDEELERFRKEFMQQPIFEEFFPGFSSVYQRLASQTVNRYRNNWVEQLWEQHSARMLQDAS